MFMGEYAHNIDKKGRMFIPAKFRDDFGNTVVVTRGLDGCLSLYTVEKWQTIYQQLLKLPSASAETRKFIRKMTSKATDCEIDAQGRILIPANLMKLAALEKECMVVGVASHVEIWAKDRWEHMDEEDEESFEEILEKNEELAGLLL